MHSKVQCLKHNAVAKKKDTRNAVALDAENNNIQVKDVVKVLDGPHSVRIICCCVFWLTWSAYSVT
jgi:transcription elongation factor SPT5